MNTNLITVMVMALIFLICVVIAFIKKKKGYLKCNYDERQKAIQGRAYKYGFFAIGIYQLFNGAICADAKPWADVLDMNFVGLAIGVFVYASYAIWNDAYVSINENLKSSILLFTIITVAYAVSFIFCILLNKPVEVIQLVGGFLFFAITIVSVVKLIYDKIHNEEEIV